LGYEIAVDETTKNRGFNPEDKGKLSPTFLHSILTILIFPNAMITLSVVEKMPVKLLTLAACLLAYSANQRTKAPAHRRSRFWRQKIAYVE
jgi:hypothetical protein